MFSLCLSFGEQYNRLSKKERIRSLRTILYYIPLNICHRPEDCRFIRPFDPDQSRTQEGKSLKEILKMITGGGNECGDKAHFRQVDIKIYSIFLLISFSSEPLKLNLNENLQNVNHDIINI